MEIKASQVKELRAMSGFRSMECKKALVDCEGDIKKALHLLRTNSALKAEKNHAKKLQIKRQKRKELQKKKLQKKVHNLGALIKEKVINFAWQRQWTIILSLYLVVIYYSGSWFERNFVIRDYQETFSVVLSLYFVWGMFKAIKSFFYVDESSCFRVFCIMGLIPIVALLDNLINAESQLLNAYLIVPVLIFIWRYIISPFLEAFFDNDFERRKDYDDGPTDYDDGPTGSEEYEPVEGTENMRWRTSLQKRRERGEFGGSSFTYGSKGEPFVETKADNRKTVYEVHVKTGAAGYQFYTSVDTLAKAEWAAGQQRKYGKEVKVVPIYK